MDCPKCKTPHAEKGRGGPKVCRKCSTRLPGAKVQESVYAEVRHPRGRDGKWVDVLGKLKHAGDDYHARRGVVRDFVTSGEDHGTIRVQAYPHGPTARTREGRVIAHDDSSFTLDTGKGTAAEFQFGDVGYVGPSSDRPQVGEVPLTPRQAREHERRLDVEPESLAGKSVGDLAEIIRKDWSQPNFAARPYLDAMHGLHSVNDSYGLDSGRSIVAYFLANAGQWKGPVAKAVKAELKKRSKR